MNVAVAHASLQVVRYHTNNIMWRFGQTNADHSCGVIMILLKLNPDPSRNLLAQAAVHDAGEKWAGDLSYPFKRKNPEAAEHHRITELALAIEHDIPQFPLTELEERWLHFADKLESYLYVNLVYPQLLEQGGWPAMKTMLENMAQSLGINQEIF